MKKILPYIYIAVAVVVVVFIFIKIKEFYEKDDACEPCEKPTNGTETAIVSEKKHDADILKQVVYAGCQMQGKAKILVSDEDARNGMITTILNARGITAKDESRWGKSPSGKRAGEIDIKIENSDGLTKNICEGLDLAYLDKNKISTHLEKIFTYDVNGLAKNFVLIYSEVKKFSTFWEKYKDYVGAYNFKYKAVSLKDISKESSCGTEVKIAVSEHYRSGVTLELYHVCINMCGTKA